MNVHGIYMQKNKLNERCRICSYGIILALKGGSSFNY